LSGERWKVFEIRVPVASAPANMLTLYLSELRFVSLPNYCPETNAGKSNRTFRCRGVCGEMLS
jgi:hypothetical protein